MLKYNYTHSNDKYDFFEYDCLWTGEKKKSKSKRSLCIGGPYENQYHSDQRLRNFDVRSEYFAFNQSDYCDHTQIFVYKSLLNK